MTEPIVLVQPEEVAVYADEHAFYDRQPSIALRLEENAWRGRTFRYTTPAMRRVVLKAHKRLKHNPWADVSDLATHYVPEPGAPLEPVKAVTK